MAVGTPSDALLAIHLFGGLRFEQRGAPFARPQRSESERLLIYLLLHRERQLDRSSIAFELWPDVIAEKARSNLRFHLYRLIASLPEAPPDLPWIVRDDRHVRWSPDADAWLDVAAFEAASAAATSGDLDADAAFEALGRATALYVGDIVPDLDEPWLDGPRAALRNTDRRVRDALVDALLARRRWSEGVAVARHRVANDPYEEHGYRQLMRAYAGLPDVGALARTFDECANALREGYGLDPSSETTALYNALLGGDAAPASDTASRTAASASPPVGTGDNASTLSAVAPSQRLPMPLTRFIGRADELVELRRLLGEHRLVTILGPGGAGKTRLAIEMLRPLVTAAGARVCWVDLAELPRGAPIVPAVARAVLPDAKSVSSIDDLAALVADVSLILALDNCEHVIEGARETADAMLAACPGLRIVATSREPLSIPGERRWPIAPLDVPDLSADSPAVIERSGAVEMFVDRAAALDATWSPSPADMRHIAAICRRLDGQPLAIEIAAARTVLLSLGDLDTQLAASLRALEEASGGQPNGQVMGTHAAVRHDSLRASVGWSYALLGTDEQTALARLSVIPGSFDLGAATAVMAGPPLPTEGAFGLVARLVEKSLIAIVPPTGTSRRFRLPQPVIDYLEEALPADDQSLSRLRMAEHFRARARIALHGAGDHRLTADVIARLQDDHVNFDVAIRALNDDGQHDTAMELASDLAPFWFACGHLRYAAEQLNELTTERERYAPTPALARASGLAGACFHWLGDFERGRQRLNAAVAQFRAVGDERGRVRALTVLADNYLAVLDLEAAGATLDEAQLGATPINDPQDQVRIDASQAELDMHLGHYAAAHARLMGILSHVTAIEPNPAEERSIRHRLARIALDVSDYPAALAELALAQANAESNGDHASIARAEHLRGIVLAEMSDVVGAHAAFRQAIDHYRSQGTPTMAARVVHGMAELALQQGQFDVAATYFQHSLDAKTRTGDRVGLLFTHLGRAELALCQSRYQDAKADVQRAFAILNHGSDPRLASWARLIRSHVRAAAGDPAGAIEDAEASLAFTLAAAQRRRAAQAHEALGVALAADRRWSGAVAAMAAADSIWAALAVDPPMFSRLVNQQVAGMAHPELDADAIATAVATGHAEGRAMADDMQRRISAWHGA